MLIASLVSTPMTVHATATSGTTKAIGEYTQQAMLGSNLRSGVTSVLATYTATALKAEPKVEPAMDTVVAAPEPPKEVVTKEFSVPQGSGYKGFKTWMDYRTITNRRSKQYQTQRQSVNSPNGFRKYQGRYCVALGSHFGFKIGDKFNLVLKNGTVIPCVMADLKSDQHTDSSHIFTRHSNCMSEFIVDSRALNANVKRMGDCSAIDGWDSPVVKVLAIDYNN